MTPCICARSSAYAPRLSSKHGSSECAPSCRVWRRCCSKHEAARLHSSAPGHRPRRPQRAYARAARISTGACQSARRGSRAAGRSVAGRRTAREEHRVRDARERGADSREELSKLASDHEVAFVIADGLSALAVQRHAVPLLEQVLPKLDWRIAPVAIVEQARVAIGDEIGELLGAQLVVVLIGERPGLSSPDSLGVYLTWKPRIGRTDAERNCISNIRADGLSYPAAAQKLLFLMNESRRLKLSG